MITKTERKKLKKYLKDDYSSEISSMLEEKGIRNRYGNPYTNQYIRVIFSGKRTNMIIEKMFFDLYSQRKEQVEQLKQIKENLLNKKTEASTSVK